MANIDQYAKWCMMLIEGEDYIVDDIFDALQADGYIDRDQEWIYDEEDEDDE